MGVKLDTFNRTIHKLGKYIADNFLAKDSIKEGYGVSINEINGDLKISINTEALMKKEDYVSEDNEEYVKKANEAKSIEGLKNAQPGMYYGTNQNGEVGIYRIPFSEESQEKGIYQMILLNPPKDSPHSLESSIKLDDCKIFIQAFKFVEGEQDIIAILKEFNNGNKDSFFYNEENVEFNDGMRIKNNHVYTSTNVEDLYESEEIDKTKFLGEMVVSLNG